MVVRDAREWQLGRILFFTEEKKLFDKNVEHKKSSSERVSCSKFVLVSNNFAFFDRFMTMNIFFV